MCSNFQLVKNMIFSHSSDTFQTKADLIGLIYRFNICIETAISRYREFSIATQCNYNGGCVSILAGQYPDATIL